MSLRPARASYKPFPLAYLVAASCAGACERAPVRAVPDVPEGAAGPAQPIPRASATGTAARSTVPNQRLVDARAAEPQLEPDGNDETTEGEVLLPARGHFERIGRHWAALERVCDFAVLGDALYLAHATRPLGLGGASLTRYRPGMKPPFSLAFNWNREGEPEQGGAGGQGFLRLRLLEGRLYVPDADPPYLGLGLVTGIEGYLFASDTRGGFASTRLPGHLPPRPPTSDRGGAFILPGSLHGFDVIRFRGKLYASTSAAIPPNGTAKSSPGTMFTPAEKPGAWQVAFSYAGAQSESSVRLGYMTRFRDRLYVALSPLYGLSRHDFLVIVPTREATTFTSADAKPVQVTPSGGVHTLRWYADRGSLYWITLGRDGAELRVTHDGHHFRLLTLPPDAGRPSDVLRAGPHLLVLTERGLYELEADTFYLRARIPEAKTPFKVDDPYCAPPLVAFQGSVYAGDQLRGALWKLVAD